jgi:hypothetical protein
VPFAPGQPIQPSGNIGFDNVGLDVAGKEEVHGRTIPKIIGAGLSVIGFPAWNFGYPKKCARTKSRRA